MTKRFVISISIVFIALAIVFVALNSAMSQYSLSVLMSGNALMALLCISTYFIVKKQVDQRPQAFVRGVYSGTFLKLFVCMIAIITYALLNRATLHKPTLFILFGIYVVYTAIETALLMKMASRTN